MSFSSLCCFTVQKSFPIWSRLLSPFDIAISRLHITSSSPSISTTSTHPKGSLFYFPVLFFSSCVLTRLSRRPWCRVVECCVRKTGNWWKICQRMFLFCLYNTQWFMILIKVSENRSRICTMCVGGSIRVFVCTLFRGKFYAEIWLNVHVEIRQNIRRIYDCHSHERVVWWSSLFHREIIGGWSSDTSRIIIPIFYLNLRPI